MNILIMGGSYFLDRTFIIVVSREKHNITLLNILTYSMKEFGGIELEKELECVCKDKGIAYSILRPGTIYGPYNYAPSESVYIQQIVTGKKLIFPSDSYSVFQFVYAKDVANAILKVLKQERSFSKYNICSDEVFTYNKYLYKLNKVCDVKFDVEYMPSYQVINDVLFAPFPLFKNESQL